MYAEKENSKSMIVTLRRAAIVGGLGLLLMTILGPIVEFNVFQTLVIPGDVTTTVENLMASVEIFRTSITLLLFVAVLDVVVAWALYILLEPAGKHLSLLMAWSRVVYGAILAISLNNLFGALRLLTETAYSTLTTNQLHAQVMLFLSMFRDGWDLGFIFFGIHLVILGYLVFRSGYISKWLGVLLVIAGLGYLIDSFGKFLIPDYNLTIALFTFFGEPILMFYLLWKGIKGFNNVGGLQ